MGDSNDEHPIGTLPIDSGERIPFEENASRAMHMRGPAAGRERDALHSGGDLASERRRYARVAVCMKGGRSLCLGNSRRREFNGDGHGRSPQRECVAPPRPKAPS